MRYSFITSYRSLYLVPDSTYGGARVAAQGAFLEVIEHYRPDLVLVWGHDRLYDYLPNAGHQGADCCGVETWIYPLRDGHEVRVLPVQHPASAFSPSEWHRTISAALED